MHQHRTRRTLACAAFLSGMLLPSPLVSQAPHTLAADSLALIDLGEFVTPTDGWRIVGRATADRRRPLRIDTEPGTGVLANRSAERRGGLLHALAVGVIRPSPSSGEDLRTRWEHGDIDLELEFMMPAASNSGVYLQGRYEVQLLDSWPVPGNAPPTSGDVGGIYERWDEARGAGRQGYEGHPPRVNAARAPGLWQKLSIRFRAPRFDAQGNKVADARFVRVELNGSLLHENVDVTGPTRGASFLDEAPSGPLVFQGDHGPVAFRNIHYKRYDAAPLSLEGLRYRVYEGEFTSVSALPTSTADRSGLAEALTASVAGVADRFALVFDGTLDVPATGRYLLDLGLNWLDTANEPGGRGGASLTIGGRSVLAHPGNERTVTTEVDLTAGQQPFTFALFKNREGRPAAFTLSVEGPGVRRQALLPERSVPRGSATGPILVTPTNERTILRGFMNSGGDKRTHVIAVGSPDGVHFSFDSRQGAVLAAWRGPFLDATQMWEGRGEPQLAVPLGSVVEFSGAPAVARLAGSSDVWPDSMRAGAGYRFLGYDLGGGEDPDLPVFRYLIGEIRVEDRITPAGDPSPNHLLRTLTISAPDRTTDVFVRLATGESIERMRDGSFRVDDRFYIAPVGERPVVRDSGAGQELLVPVDLRRGTRDISYAIIW